LNKEGITAFREQLVGKGYISRFPGAKKSFRDGFTGTSIDLIEAGEFPGDGTPKEVAFPEPEACSFTVEIDGVPVQFIDMANLINLKLTSALSLPSRLKDKVDVMELVKAANLTEDYARYLHPSVCSAFQEIVKIVEQERELEKKRERD
jgi:hypothetical protein